MDQRGMVILSGNSHPDLAKDIVRHLDVRLGSSSVYHKTNRETMVEIHESVRGKDVYIIQTGTKAVNDSIMELLIMCYACKTSSCNKVIGVIPHMPYSRHNVNDMIMETLITSYACKTSTARRIIGVIPYLPYSTQSKMRRRGNISLKLIANMLTKGGFDHIITVDLHSKESLGYFDCAIDNVRASPFLIQYIVESVSGLWVRILMGRCFFIIGKMFSRGAITCKLLAKMLTQAGISHVITLDLHQKEIQGFFDCPVDNLRASPFLVRYIQESIPDYRNAVIVAKNPLAARRATSYAERLRLAIAVIHGEVKDGDDEIDELDGRASPPPGMANRVTTVGATLPPLTAKEKPPINVVGDVGGKIAIMVDDMIDDVQAFVDAAFVLKERGAYKIYALATHGILSKEAPRLIEESHIDEVVVTNTVPHDLQKLQCHKIKTVDISILLAEAIRRIHNKESMSHLFRHVTLED